MYKLATVILLISSPAFAQANDVFKDCKAIGQTSKGDMVYGLDCSALKAENKTSDYKPKMAPTDMSETVIPKAGATQKPDSAPTTGLNK